MKMKNEIVYGGLELNNLVSLYNETGEEKYFNELWYKVKAFAIMKSKRYPSIEFEEVITNAMECLWVSLNNIRKGANLLTYYGRILETRFYDIYHKRMQTGKYKINSEALSIEGLKEDAGFEPSINEMPFNLELFEYECKLAGMEITIIELINAGYKQKEIINQLQMDKETYKSLLEGIKNKVKVNYLGQKVRI